MSISTHAQLLQYFINRLHYSQKPAGRAPLVGIAHAAVSAVAWHSMRMWHAAGPFVSAMPCDSSSEPWRWNWSGPEGAAKASMTDVEAHDVEEGPIARSSAADPELPIACVRTRLRRWRASRPVPRHPRRTGCGCGSIRPGTRGKAQAPPRRTGPGGLQS